MSTSILLVDDDPDTVEIYSAVLEHNGYTVFLAENGTDGIRMAREHRPDLILMDLEMPVVDGLMATEILKRDPWTAGIPIVAFTIHDRVRSRRKLFDGYLVKPCPWEAVLAEIERLLGPAGGKRVPAPPSGS